MALDKTYGIVNLINRRNKLNYSLSFKHPLLLDKTRKENMVVTRNLKTADYSEAIRIALDVANIIYTEFREDNREIDLREYLSSSNKYSEYAIDIYCRVLEENEDKCNYTSEDNNTLSRLYRNRLEQINNEINSGKTRCSGVYTAGNERIKFSNGIFHKFSTDCGEKTIYPVAIVELEDGTVVLPYASDIKFNR